MTEAHKIEPLTDSNGVLCYVVQGGCSDGTYYYVGLNNGNKTTDSITAVRKYEIATGKLVATYENLRVSHCNDMEYLPHTGEIVFVHNTPDRWHISFYDAATMQPSIQTRWGDGTSHTITLYYKGADGGRGEQMEIYSLTYDRFESCYWVGISNGYKFAKLDLNFNHTGDIYQGKETGYTKQGMTCDSKYIYFQQYKTNAILVYDKAGNFVREIPLTKTSNEPENIYYVGDVFYVAYLINKNGSMLYKVELKQVSAYDVSVKVNDTFTTIPQFTAEDGTLYKVAQGSCTDGTYLYVILNDDNKSGASGHQSTLFKIDIRTGAIVQRVENIDAGSSNDMTYNPNTRELLIATDNPNKNRIVVIDAATLTVKKDLTIATKTFAIAYDEAQNSYWLTCAGTYDFVRADTDLKQIGDVYAGYNTGYTKQAMDYDGEYLYFLQSGTNAVSIFRKDGVFIGVATFPALTYTLPNGTTATASSVQSICHVGDTFYIGCYFADYGCVIYECEIDIKG